MRRLIVTIGAAFVLSLVFVGGPKLAEACAGLIGPNGAVNLGRTTTMAGYHEGIEHYVTSFEFQGGGGEFGSIIPLPGVPTKVEKGGAWTLQRLELETRPPAPEALGFSADSAGPSLRSAVVLQEFRIDALDITVLEGGGASVGQWATDHGFRLSPDAPEVLDFYAERSPIFLAAVFDGDAAAERGQAIGDGTPVHVTIPTTNPWVPLRILALGKPAIERVQANVYLLTDERPALLWRTTEGTSITHSDRATTSLLDDLRSDEGMSWVPDSAWLTKMEIDSEAGDMTFDLAVDASGQGQPSRVAAGLDVVKDAGNGISMAVIWSAAALAMVVLFGVAVLRMPQAARPQP
jgi:hypothetical protein